MNVPRIRYYALMELAKGTKTPKYVITRQAGFYEPVEELRGRDGKVSMYLMEQSREEKGSTPPVRLQAARSLNFTGLKDYWIEGKVSGFAYGYPLDKPTYSKEKKPNPFYSYKDDGFLFIIHQDEKDTSNQTPTAIELVVLEGAKVLISAYCKQLVMGGFDEALEALRKQAYKVDCL